MTGRPQHAAQMRLVVLALVVAIGSSAGTATVARAAARADKPLKVWTWEDRAYDFAAVRVIVPAPLSADDRERVDRGIKTADDAIRQLVLDAFAARGYAAEVGSDDQTGSGIDGSVLQLHHDFAPPAQRGQGQGRRPILGAPRAHATVEIERDVSNQLYVELRDPQTDMPVWRGRVRRVLTHKTEPAARLAAAASAIADAFPRAPASAATDR